MNKTNQEFSLDQYLMHHVQDSHEWHIPFIGVIKLPEPISLHGLMLLITSSFLLILFGVLYNRKQRVPTGITNLLESFVMFIRDDIAVPSLGKEDGIKMTPLFCTFFFFILGLNLIGLIPLFATATANINVTAALAAITFCFMVGGAIYKNGIGGFFQAFIPSGVPAPLLILLFPIEFAGLFIKTFALMIRLFANLLAGHIVIMSLLGLGLILGSASLIFLFPMAVSIYILEVFVAFLQAYVFTLLSAMFIGQMIHPNH